MDAHARIEQQLPVPQRMTEVNYAANIDLQNYTFHGLAVGYYVLVYWDDGGTQYATGNPEISKGINIFGVFSQPANLQIFSLAQTSKPSTSDTTATLYPTGFLALPDTISQSRTRAQTPITTNARWFYTTDQGNRNNAKFTLEPGPPGFVDTMFKFKIFPPCAAPDGERSRSRCVTADLTPFSQSLTRTSGSNDNDSDSSRRLSPRYSS